MSDNSDRTPTGDRQDSDSSDATRQSAWLRLLGSSASRPMLYAPGCAVARSKAIRLMVSGLSAYWHQEFCDWR